MTRLLYSLLLAICTQAASIIPLTESQWSSANLPATVAAAVDGDIFILGPGTNTWNGTTLTLSSDTKRLWFLGSGTNQTRWIGTNVSRMINITGSPTNSIVICDIYFDGHASDAIIGGGYNPGDTRVYDAYWAIYNNMFMLRNAAGIRAGSGGGYGYIAQNKFIRPLGLIVPGNYIVTIGNEYLSWALPSPIGTTNMWYIEDNEFFAEKIGANWYPSNGQWDGYNGSSAAYRYNTAHGAPTTGWHGYDSQVTSMRYGEMTGNIFTNYNGDNLPGLTRGGVFNAISNRVYGTVTTNQASFGLQYYRSAWGSYQMSTAMQGANRTNNYTGTVLSAGAGSITVTNVPYLGPQYRFNATSTPLTPSATADGWAGWILWVVGGTGLGQIRLVSTTTMNNANGQYESGTVTFNVSTNWSVTPDATSTFQLCPWPGAVVQLGNQDNYTFTTNTPTGLINRQVFVALNPDGTPDVATTLDNWKRCINGEPTNLVNYGYTATTIANGRAINWDLSCPEVNTNYLVLQPVMDGTGTLNYPGTQQEGVISVVKGTNTGVVMLPCISMGNLLNDTDPLGFTLNFTATVPVTWPFFNTNSVVAGRDFYDTNALNFTPQPYPFPLRSTIAATNVVVTISTSGASPTITTSEDLYAGTGAGARTYHVGQPITNTAPATSGEFAFSEWLKDGASYTTDLSFAYTNDITQTFTAVYLSTSSGIRATLDGRAVLGTGRAVVQ